jgi:uncharacterized RDD family membrane protein YckC
MSQLATPGWYPDPQAPHARVRWWDGRAWTAHTEVVSAGRYTDDGERLAGWWQRVGQYLIDSLLVTAVAGVVLLPFKIAWFRSHGPQLQHMFDSAARSGRPLDQAELNHLLFPLTITFGLATALTFCLYNAVSLHWRGRTLGMTVLRLHVRTPGHRGGRLAWPVIGRRLLAQQAGAVAYLPFIPLGFQAASIAGWLASLWVLLDVLWPLWDRRSQTLHDKFAGTLLVRRP